MKKLLLLSVALLAAFNLMAAKEDMEDNPDLFDVTRIMLSLRSGLVASSLLTCSYDKLKFDELPGDIIIHRGKIVVDADPFKYGTTISVDENDKPIEKFSNESICRFCTKLAKRIDKDKDRSVENQSKATMFTLDIPVKHAPSGKNRQTLYVGTCPK